MVQVAKKHIHRHKKPLIIVGVLAFLVTAFFVIGFNKTPVFSALNGVVYPDTNFGPNQFPNCTGSGCSSHFEVLNDNPYDAGNYISTGTSTDSDLEEEFTMTSVSGPSDMVTQVAVRFNGYISGGCNGNGSSNCDSIDVNIYIGGGYQSSQNIVLSGSDVLHTAIFNGSWTGDSDLRVELIRRVEGGGSPSGRDDNVIISRLYADITYITAPTVTTLTADPGTSPDPSTSAVLNGEVNPNADQTNAWFVWDINNVACGSMSNTTPSENMGSGISTVGMAPQTITGLNPDTTYYYCAAANKPAAGPSVVYGSKESFTTDTAAPYVNTVGASEGSPTSWLLSGDSQPNGLATNGWFVWSNVDPAGSCANLVGANPENKQSLGSGNTPQAFSETITTLPSEQYWYCAVAENAKGRIFGEDGSGVVQPLTFTTSPVIPDPINTNPADNITGTTATLHGEANPQGDPTIGWFRYSTTNPGTCNDTFGVRPVFAGDDNLGQGRSLVGYDQPISGLQPSITYYYCAIAENSAGKNFGSVQQFTTLTAAPGPVSTQSATNIASHAAELNASVRPNGEFTEVWFRLWKYPASAPATCSDAGYMLVPVSSADYANAGSGTSLVNVSFNITESYSAANSVLDQADSDYYYCAVARNSKGTTVASNAPVLFHTLLGSPPIVETLNPPTGVQNTSATLRARVNPNNNMTDVRFHWGSLNTGSCNTLANTEPWVDDIGNDNTWHNFFVTLIGLTGNTTYYYCAEGVNWDGTTYSSPIASFSTAVASVDTNVSGWAWSENIGWISFSSINCDSNNDQITDNVYYSSCSTGQPTTSYGLDIDYVSLVLSGWAWSENIGWISFDRAVTGPPPTGEYDPTTGDIDGDGNIDCTNCIAVANRTNKKVYGWARAISACQNDLWNGSACTGVGAGNNAGGWDGWIRMDEVGVSYNGATINTSLLPDEFEGWAWGGGGNRGVVGWISTNSFNLGSSPKFAVYLEDYGGKPSAENLDVIFDRGAATGGRGAGEEWVCRSYDRLMWDYSDTYPFEYQTAYRVQVATDSSFLSVVFDSGKVISGAQSRALEIGIGNDLPLFNTNYYWRLQVWDTTDQVSPWIEYDANGDSIPDTFRTSLHPYPRVNFDWIPEDPSENEEVVRFQNTTIAGSVNPLTWLWSIPGGTYVNGTNSITASPEVQFANSGWRIVKLTATDSVLAGDTNYPGSGTGICYKEADLYVQFPIPEYDEINPVGKMWEGIKDLFAKLNIFNIHYIKDRFAYNS